MILHGIKAVSTSIQDQNEYKNIHLYLANVFRLNSKSIEVAIVGLNQSFKLLSQEENQSYLDRLKDVFIFEKKKVLLILN